MSILAQISRPDIVNATVKVGIHGATSVSTDINNSTFKYKAGYVGHNDLGAE